MNRFTTKAAYLAAGVLAVLAIALAVYFALILKRLPREPIALAPTPEPPADATRMPTPEAWNVFRMAGAHAGNAGPLGERFRLAGTFFLYGDDGSGDAAARRRAIIDDLTEKKQLLVSEEDEIEGYTVSRIETDRVRLRRDGIEVELTLSFSAVSATAGGASTPRAAEAPSMEDLPALETTRFGKRVGENRWVIRRDELLRYYAELLDDPERIANVYASLKPKYEENNIAGYVLNSEGEADFFRAIGLQEGDVIRRVNSMRMVSQRRAEYFISEFMKNRVSALVFDVERGEKEEKLIYLIR